MTPPTLLLYCTCDRFNYGDTLFPAITRGILADYLPGLQCSTYGVAARDMRPFGGDQVGSIADLTQSAPPGATVLIAGGEILAQTWLATTVSLVNKEELPPLFEMCARDGVDAVDLICQARLGGSHRLPLVLSASDFAHPVQVAYHSVGGWPLRGLDCGLQRHVAETLSSASFASVRDRETARCLRLGSPDAEFRVTPDVVSLVSEVWDRPILSAVVSPAIRDWVDTVGPYICFQCNPHFNAEQRSEIREQLNKLHARTGLPILLLPLARMSGYDDRDFLSTLDLGPWAHYLEVAATIQEITYLLAQASLFVGTSLHGVITSLSYEVPFVGLATNDPKLGNYHESWLEGFSTVPVSAMVDSAVERLQAAPAAVQALSHRLRRHARLTVELLARQIMQSQSDQAGEPVCSRTV